MTSNLTISTTSMNIESFPSPRPVLPARLSYLVEEQLAMLRAKLEDYIERVNCIEVAKDYLY